MQASEPRAAARTIPSCRPARLPKRARIRRRLTLGCLARRTLIRTSAPHLPDGQPPSASDMRRYSLMWAIFSPSSFFMPKVALARDHDPLCLGTARAVHGLRTVTDRPPYRGLGFRSGAGFSGGFPWKRLPLPSGISPRIYRASGSRKSFSDGAVTMMPPAISPQADNLIWEARYVLFAYIGKQQVNDIVARFRLMPFRRARNTARIQRFVEVRHLDQLVLDVRSLCRAVGIPQRPPPHRSARRPRRPCSRRSSGGDSPRNAQPACPRIPFPH